MEGDSIYRGNIPSRQVSKTLYIFEYILTNFIDTI